MSLCLLVGLAAVAGASDPQVSNRAPLPNEIGYQPADGSALTLNPPSLTWLVERGAQTYTVQWSRDNDFSRAQTVEAHPWNTYTHHKPLAKGTWFWRYRFMTGDGAASDWSSARSFVVPGNTIEFPMPTPAQQAARVPEGRPRVFMRPEDLPRLRELAAGPKAGLFGALRSRADQIIERGPTPEPAHPGSARDKENEELLRYWWPNRTQTVSACVEAETIAFVYLITGEEKYRQAARKWILHLASWDPDGPTNFALNCEAGKPLIHRLPRAYDWAYDALTPEDREVVRAVMLRRATDVWNSGEVGRGVGHLNRPFGSHSNRTWHKLAECAVAFLGEIPEAARWLDYAVNKFYACYPVWADEDGGWHEGAAYWSSYISKAAWWLQLADSALDIDGFKKPFFANVMDFAMYMAPPNTPHMGFADQAYRVPKSFGGFVDYYLRMAGNRSEAARASYWRWWADAWNSRSEPGVLGFLYAANLPPLPDPKTPDAIPQSKVFRGIGVASLHTTLLDSNDDVHFLFKSSPFGRQSHGHNPHNSFMLTGYGDELLATCVYRDLHGSKFHRQWAHETLAHNVVLVNGVGQGRPTASPDGRIADFQLTPNWDYVVGDATAAYGNLLKRFHRHVVFVKPGLILLYDDLEAAQPSTFQFMLHALAPFSVNAQDAVASVKRPKAGVIVHYLSPAPLSFRQWDGYEPPPTRNTPPNQWHLEAATGDKRSALGMLTVLAPHRSGNKPELGVTRLESESAIGISARIDGREIIVAILKHDAKRGALAGMEFDGPVLVRTGKGGGE